MREPPGRHADCVCSAGVRRVVLVARECFRHAVVKGAAPRRGSSNRSRTSLNAPSESALPWKRGQAQCKQAGLTVIRDTSLDSRQ